MVHSNIWGPSRVKSILGFQYFVTFIDDYSICTWLFLMKNRSELFHIFQSFFNEIKTHFGVSIKVLRSDNGCEYLSHSFKQFMASHGILHQTCAYTPQQNGVAECKNRHLIETTHTLLIYGEVLEHFWGDAILTACYLVNHMLFSVLDNNIPHFILFPHEPLHPLPLRVFESTYFVHNFSPGFDKLYPKLHQCVFLGFTRSQKGYKCFSPCLNRILCLQMSPLMSSPFILRVSLHLCLHPILSTLLVHLMFLLFVTFLMCLLYHQFLLHS